MLFGAIAEREAIGDAEVADFGTTARRPNPTLGPRPATGDPPKVPPPLRQKTLLPAGHAPREPHAVRWSNACPPTSQAFNWRDADYACAAR